jgi:hypothetical protein
MWYFQVKQRRLRFWGYLVCVRGWEENWDFSVVSHFLLTRDFDIRDVFRIIISNVSFVSFSNLSFCFRRRETRYSRHHHDSRNEILSRGQGIPLMISRVHDFRQSLYVSVLSRVSITEKRQDRDWTREDWRNKVTTKARPPEVVPWLLSPWTERSCMKTEGVSLFHPLCSLSSFIRGGVN